MDHRNGEGNARLVTAPEGPTTGLLARALACGAHLSVHRGEAWNVLYDSRYPQGSRARELRNLRENWGVTVAADWDGLLSGLLSDESSDGPASTVLGIRRRATGRLGEPIDGGTWDDAIGRYCGQRGIGWRNRRVLTRAAEAVLRYEQRFHADGLLESEAVVHSVHAYDFGRAVNMVRWGYRAGYCDQADAEQMVLYAGEQCHRYYASWSEFSAGYILGRLLRFDRQKFGHWYDTALVPHQILVNDAGSPWRQLPWSIQARTGPPALPPGPGSFAKP